MVSLQTYLVFHPHNWQDMAAEKILVYLCLLLRLNWNNMCPNLNFCLLCSFCLQWRKQRYEKWAQIPHKVFCNNLFFSCSVISKTPIFLHRMFVYTPFFLSHSGLWALHPYRNGSLFPPNATPPAARVGPAWPGRAAFAQLLTEFGVPSSQMSGLFKSCSPQTSGV